MHTCGEFTVYSTAYSAVCFHSHLLTLSVQFRLSLVVVAFLFFFYSFQLGLAKMLIHSALTSVSVWILYHLKHATCDYSTYYSINVWFWISLPLSLFHFCWLRAKFVVTITVVAVSVAFLPYIYIYLECHFCISVQPYKHLAMERVCRHTFRMLPKSVGLLRIFIFIVFTSSSSSFSLVYSNI